MNLVNGNNNYDYDDEICIVPLGRDIIGAG